MMRRRYLLPVLCLVTLVLILGAFMAHGRAVGAAPAAKFTKARVVDVIDGDTIVVQWLAGPRLPSTRVRLIGVDAPAVGKQAEPYGQQAAGFTRKHLKGKVVWLEKDVSEKDKYGRALRYVWLSQPPAKPSASVARKHMFNARLVAEGYARVWTVPPDVRYASLFLALEREARTAKKGFWKNGGSTGGAAGMVRGSGGYACPKGYPIKGNLSSRGEKIYHVPGGAFYDKTKPEYCFRSEKDAQKAGFRRSKR